MQTIFDDISRQLPGRLPDESLRLFHGRGATMPGYEFLTIDWFPPLIHISLYDQRDPEWIDQLGRQLTGSFGSVLQGIVVQFRGSRHTEARLISGSVPEPGLVREEGLLFAIEPLAAQNIGFFPDMKPGRKLVRNIAAGKKVLNLFAYTCSLSVAAISGGAEHVVNLDMNRNLLDRGRENHRLNGHDLRQVAFLPYNLFKSFGRLQKEGPFDLVIIDPPYRQGTSFRAERDWPKILRKLPGLLGENGEVIAAVSAPELGKSFLANQFTENLPQAALVTELTAGPDFPEADPDKGLHILHYRLKE